MKERKANKYLSFFYSFLLAMDKTLANQIPDKENNTIFTLLGCHYLEIGTPRNWLVPNYSAHHVSFYPCSLNNSH